MCDSYHSKGTTKHWVTLLKLNKSFKWHIQKTTAITHGTLRAEFLSASFPGRRSDRQTTEHGKWIPGGFRLLPGYITMEVELWQRTLCEDKTLMMKHFLLHVFFFLPVKTILQHLTPFYQSWRISRASLLQRRVTVILLRCTTKGSCHKCDFGVIDFWVNFQCSRKLCSTLILPRSRLR